MSEQLIFNLPHLSSQGAEDFLVSDSNQAAVDLVNTWADWPNVAVVISGAAGVGKSHLANIWSATSKAVGITAEDLDEARVAALPRPAIYFVEDIDRGIASEQALFHLLNLVREQRGSVLLTSRTEPGELQVTLPDLRSRLRALPVVAIDPPDDALLQGLLVKLFMDRQLRVEPATVRYLLTHMERSAEAAVRVVDEMDRMALTKHRRVTKLLAREVLSKLFPVKH